MRKSGTIGINYESINGLDVKTIRQELGFSSREVGRLLGRADENGGKVVSKYEKNGKELSPALRCQIRSLLEWVSAADAVDRFIVDKEKRTVYHSKFPRFIAKVISKESMISLKKTGEERSLDEFSIEFSEGERLQIVNFIDNPALLQYDTIYQLLDIICDLI